MRKREKGFTLIELLVVVAIIGALAAVGVVAYNGYTAAAKKNSSKSIHANIVKYIASERAKCELDSDSTIFDAADSVDCSSDGSTLATMLTGGNSPLSDKDPFDGGAAAVSAASATKPEGDSVIVGTDADATTGKSEITITTQFSKTTTDVLENTIKIE